MLAQLISRFGHDRLAHGMNGVDFHHLQSQRVPGFCSDARLAELRAVVPAMAAGRFEQRFAAPARSPASSKPV